MNSRSVTVRAVGIGVLCVAALAVCLGLAWWQWDRFSSAGGTYQNLGYVLQWPLFGLFPAFMVWRWRVLSRRRSADSPSPSDLAESSVAAPPSESAAQPTETGSEATRSEPAPTRRAALPFGPNRAARGTSGGGGVGSGNTDGNTEDPELADYNRYLAELNARDQEVK